MDVLKVHENGFDDLVCITPPDCELSSASSKEIVVRLLEFVNPTESGLAVSYTHLTLPTILLV